MSFFRHREIYRSDVSRVVRERRNHRSRPHCLDEFPSGYSLAGCSLALPTSASPAGPHSAMPANRCARIIQPTANYVLTFCVTPGVNRRDRPPHWRTSGKRAHGLRSGTEFSIPGSVRKDDVFYVHTRKDQKIERSAGKSINHAPPRALVWARLGLD